jgi:hypothetical protein
MPAFGISEHGSCAHADKEGVACHGVAEQGSHGAVLNTESDRHTSGSEWHTSGFQTTPPTCLQVGPPGFQRLGCHLHAAPTGVEGRMRVTQRTRDHNSPSTTPVERQHFNHFVVLSMERRRGMGSR